MLPVVFSLFLTASVPSSACDDSMAKAGDVEADFLGTVTPDDNPEDSCQWEAPRAQHPEWENPSERESDRVSLSLAQSPGSSVKSTLRQQAESDGWKSRFELQQDTLTRRRLEWNEKGWKENGWHVAVGDMNDPDLPLWPRWLPRRALPSGWNEASESDALFANTSIPQGFGARAASEKWSAYAVTAWDPVQTKDAPPWEKPWELHDFSAGFSAAVSASLPWIASLQFAETRISRNAIDSVTNEVASLELASPQKRLTVNGAWTSSTENSSGGWALGAKLTQPFSDSAKLELTLRERNTHWNSPWDPTSQDGSKDSGSDWGAGEAITSLRLPLHLYDGKGLAKGEAYAAWNPQAGTGKFGARGEVEWREKGVLLEARGTHRQSVNASGSASLHDFLALETALGDNPKWRMGAYRIWERASTREGLSFALDTRWDDLRFRPGILIESTKNRELSGSASLALHWKLGDGWALEANGTAPCGSSPDWSEVRWRTTLRYLR